MKKAIWTIVVIIIVAVAAFAYVTRPVVAPTEDINQTAGKLPAGSATSTLYRVSQSGSTAEFRLNELLNGKPKLVIGTTTQVAGDIEVAENGIIFGEMRLDARTLVTDSGARNGAIQRLILRTGTAGNEYIVFKPSMGYSGPFNLGEPVSFDLPGDLAVSGVTKPVVFHVTATVAADKVTGTATATVKRSDFGLVIPNIPFVANVDDAVSLSVAVSADRVMR